ncbi:NBS-LRR protein [Sesbania bispinosa]|nr:NBS-LRR protein [Sesbania bispinosa]
MQDSPLLATSHATLQGSHTTKAISGEAVASDRASTPSGGAGEDDQGSHHGDQSPLSVVADRSVGGPKESPSKEVACSKTIGSPGTSFTQLGVPQVVVLLSSTRPISKAHSHLAGGDLLLSSLLSEGDSHMLNQFFERHTGFLVPDARLPSAFLKPAYTLFADLLRFLRSHTFVELIGASKERVLVT